MLANAADATTIAVTNMIRL